MKIGAVLEDKYEILKEIGRGGMSTVYLAMDRRLNKQWAVKEIRKPDGGTDKAAGNAASVTRDEENFGRLLKEADLMKRLDHPALPRIVDIIDGGSAIYIVMDYIEGESLDKILKTEGPRPEKLVIKWAKELCDALSYLHSQSPSVIYRDMKPANVMLKPEGNVKIIDFGIAREYGSENPDTAVLGTKGYAPPEQYAGQTDARSDIFALGMTMHHLLTGVSPLNAEGYVPVRRWNPDISEGVEAIIDKCVRPDARDRYQSCKELYFDLCHPELVTEGFRKKQKRKLLLFAAAGVLSVILALGAGVIRLKAVSVRNHDYEAYLASAAPSGFYEAAGIYPGRATAYEKLVEYYRAAGASESELTKLAAAVESNAAFLDAGNPETARLYYDVGKLCFSETEGTLKRRVLASAGFFESAVKEGSGDFEGKNVAKCYALLCAFLTQRSVTSEHSADEYKKMLGKLREAVGTVSKESGPEANYDRMSLYYAAALFVNDQAEYMAGVGIGKDELTGLLDGISIKAGAVTSTLSYVNSLKGKIESSIPAFTRNVDAKYDEVAGREGG